MVLVSKSLIVEGLFCSTKLGQILLKKSAKKILIFQINCEIYDKQHFKIKFLKQSQFRWLMQQLHYFSTACVGLGRHYHLQ